MKKKKCNFLPRVVINIARVIVVDSRHFHLASDSEIIERVPEIGDIRKVDEGDYPWMPKLKGWFTISAIRNMSPLRADFSPNLLIELTPAIPR